MGKIENKIYDELCEPVACRNNNRIRVYRKDNGEVVIHYRDMKVVLLTEEERREWKEGFSRALEELRRGDYFANDL